MLVSIPRCSRLLQYTGTTPTAIGWLSHCSIQSKRSSTLKYNTKLYFLSTNILEYIISITDSLNELVNSNDNHVHTIIVELCEPLGLS